MIWDKFGIGLDRSAYVWLGLGKVWIKLNMVGLD